MHILAELATRHRICWLSSYQLTPSVLRRFRLALAIRFYHGGANGSPDNNRFFQHIRRRVADIQAGGNDFATLELHVARGTPHPGNAPDDLHKITREERREKFNLLIANKQSLVAIAKNRTRIMAVSSFVSVIPLSLSFSFIRYYKKPTL